MPDIGIHLELRAGHTTLRPVPAETINALVNLEVRQNDRQRDGFQITFTLGRPTTAFDYSLFESGQLDPPNHIAVIVIIQGIQEVLINGVITRHQFIPSRSPGQSKLTITGEDTSLEMDLHERTKTYRNSSDSAIVEEILQDYPDLMPNVTTTPETPSENVRIVSQQKNDLPFVQQLAQQNSFVFFTEPTRTPGQSEAYWGTKERTGLLPQRPLAVNMGSETNVEQISFDYDALRPVRPQANVLDLGNGRSLPIQLPDNVIETLSRNPAPALRSTIRRDTAGLDNAQAELRLQAEAQEAAETLTATGTLDVTLYRSALRSRRNVLVTGAGNTHNGIYYVKRVTHTIKPGEYKQQFTLTREGRGVANGFGLS